ncbi:hypothetical protein DBR36_07910 [Microbacterium sp. HMWF026]|uniref:hypothetical protein n=1 Tax=Microbacterium sp. HMWF026 TaxID=2056861 RepID=UPI000D334034|nr:hypothetical protein [Microbacterium sp. HMWF026]PTT19285.1 hypothetical protein DBR36_07910 [Microbacterium sp. HMWF026]
MMRHARLAGVVGIAIAASVVSGCSQLPFHDDSYETEIPAALEAADLGITDAFAGITLSGFSETLVVGGLMGDSVVSTDDVSSQFVQKVIAVALEGRSVHTAYFKLALGFGEYEFISTDRALAELGADPRSDGSISMQEAEQIARDDSE